MASKKLIKQICQQGTITILGLTSLVLGLNSCTHSSAGNDPVTIVQSDVMVTQPIVKDVTIYKEFQGITLFTRHLQIRAQSTGIISKCFILTGEKIQTGQPLFILKSREATILNSSSRDDKILSQMADTVLSFSSGIIDQVRVQQGDFVQEGDILATSVSEESMRIVVSVPLEENTSVIQNKRCLIILPDGRCINGTSGAFLPIANNNDQTIRFLVYPGSGQGLSENIHVRVKVKNQDIKNGIFVPKSSVYSNEELTKHWVLKVFHDSVAVKVPVYTGVEIDSLIQVTNESLQLTDHVIFKGGYGLPDSAYINVIQSNSDAKK